MMDYFEQAVELVLSNEGGFVDNPADPGGATNFGISLRFLRALPPERLKKYGFFEPLDVSQIRDMTLDQAKLIYRGEFWDAVPFAQLAEPNIATYIFDMCVNHGIAQGVKLAQRAVWAVMRKFNYIPDDGVLGVETIRLLNRQNQTFVIILIAERAGFMRQLAAVNPKLDGEFLHGWLARCYRV